VPFCGEHEGNLPCGRALRREGFHAGQGGLLGGHRHKRAMRVVWPRLVHTPAIRRRAIDMPAIGGLGLDDEAAVQPCWYRCWPSNAVTHGWRWYKVENNKLLSPLVGNLELPRDGILDRAYFIPGAEDAYWTALTVTARAARYDYALTFGQVDGPLTLDETMSRINSMRSTKYRAQIIIADNPLRLRPFYDLMLMQNDFQLNTMLAVEQMFKSQGAGSSAARPLHVSFVCSYNVGRSVMAAAMFAQQLRSRGLADAVRVTSAGTANWMPGSPMDPLGAEVLRANGYQVPLGHRSAPVNHATAAGADLVVVMERHHVAALRECGVPTKRVRLLRSFDPSAQYTDVKNPYTAADFRYCFGLIEAALPGLHAWVDARLAVGPGTDAAPGSPVTRTGRERMGAAK
jgi:protein-tyrosine phosphatase